MKTIYFDYFIIVIIFLNAIQLALDTPLLDPESEEHKILMWIDFGTTMIFIIEALIKIIACGFISNGEQSYLRKVWN